MTWCAFESSSSFSPFLLAIGSLVEEGCSGPLTGSVRASLVVGAKVEAGARAVWGAIAGW